MSLALTRDANLDTQSSDISAEEIRESGRSFKSLIVCGKKLLLYASLLAGISLMTCRLALFAKTGILLYAIPFFFSSPEPKAHKVS